MLNQSKNFWEEVVCKVKSVSVLNEDDYFELIEDYKGRFFENPECVLNTNVNPDIVIWAILETLKKNDNIELLNNLSRDELGKDGKLYY